MSEGVNATREDTPLTVEIVDGLLTIRIGVATLVHVVQHDPKLEHYDEAEGEFYSPEVTSASVFAQEVLRQLLDEEEDGSTLVHRMIDKAVENAIDCRAEGIETVASFWPRITPGSGII